MFLIAPRADLGVWGSCLLTRNDLSDGGSAENLHQTHSLSPALVYEALCFPFQRCSSPGCERGLALVKEEAVWDETQLPNIAGLNVGRAGGVTTSSNKLIRPSLEICISFLAMEQNSTCTSQ